MTLTKIVQQILVYDPSLAEAERVRAELHSEGHLHVTVLIEVQQLVPFLQATPVDLLIFNLDNACIDERAAGQEILRQFCHCDCPVLVTSARPQGETLDLASAAGASDYLSKPFSAKELVFRVRNLLALAGARRDKARIESDLEREVAARTAKLDMLIKNGLMIALERDPSKLLQHVLFKGRDLLQCDGATMYLVTEQKTLAFAYRTKDDPLPAGEIPLYDASTGKPNEHYVCAYSAIHGTSVLVDDVYQEGRFDLSGTRRFDAESGYRTVSMLTVPIAPRQGEVVGVIQFINAVDPVTGGVVAFSPDLLDLVEAFAAQAAVALDNLRLVEGQKALVENMIQVIATAIDAKSPYTGRHCSRVPELAVMLAETVSATASGPLASFRFNSEDEWREFRIGAWLHDCGKVTTPEYVIDKATKLETIYNRIHEIRVRFEVLLRDAQIERLLALAEGTRAHDADRAFETRKSQLEADFAFVARSNIGSERMTDADIERILEIGATPWLRHFDDRLGLSAAEAERFDGEPIRALPAVEQLLVDAHHHLVPRTLEDLPPPGYGFKMDVPEYLYNRGEIHNLCIRRGTLTEEDRYKINEHMVFTIMMLEQMKFPRSLSRVPEYAGTHHEALNGRGYPRRLSAEDLSIPARIMAIADVFEAVTASDRPYKRPNKISEAVRILHRLKMNGQIDGDVFDLFLTSGLYLQYANRFLEPEQIDEVDITRYLGPVSEAAA